MDIIMKLFIAISVKGFTNYEIYLRPVGHIRQNSFAYNKYYQVSLQKQIDQEIQGGWLTCTLC